MINDPKDVSLAERITAMRRARDAQKQAAPTRARGRFRIGTIRRHTWTRGTGPRAIVVTRQAPVENGDAWSATDHLWAERTLPHLLDDAGCRS
ncbi:hypothetical protein [Embleya sp. NPDC059237]|uniref:hypothetical protein n=1 Tax=Embleya sp. NPDC059237 TaxID=3346784 RepID=UPI0036BC0B70